METLQATKICSRCGDPKPTSEFGRNFDMADNLKSWCKECEKVRARNYDRSRTEEKRFYEMMSPVKFY